MSIITRIFAAIGVLATSSFLISILIGLYLVGSSVEKSLPSRMVLNFDFRENVTEKGNGSPLAAAMGETSDIPLRILISAIDRAAKDKRVVGLTARLADADLNYAQVEEIRAAIKRFREEDKFAYAYADSFGETGSANSQYWLASAFDKIWIQPMGMIGLTGPAASVPYAGEALKKIGISADLHQRHEYKAASDTFTKSEMPDPVRQNYRKFLDDINEQIIMTIAEDRQIPREKLVNLMNKAPILTQEAAEAKLVDKIGYIDEFYHTAKWEGTAKPKLEFDESGNKIKPASKDEKSVSNENTTETAEEDNDKPEPKAESEIGTAAEAEAKTETVTENVEKPSPADTDSTNTIETAATTDRNDTPPLPPKKPEELRSKGNIDDFATEMAETLGEKEFARPAFIHPLTYYQRTSAELSNESETSTQEEELNIAALIYAEGPIVRLTDQKGPLGERLIADAETIVWAINQAIEDKQIKAIILRIDSPGGSVTASESIRRALQRAKEKGKYVVVSMGGTAASGGYWIATAADKIIASPSTVTGSIGVVSGKFSYGDLAEKLGINFEELTTSDHGGMWSAAETFSPSEMKRLNAILDHIYTEFTERVSESRNLTPDQVEAVARGRVWSGKTAQELGLVDELGGLKEAYTSIKEHLKLEEDTPLYVMLLPGESSPIEEIMNLIESLLMGTALSISADDLPRLLVQSLSNQIGLAPPTGPLSAPQLNLQ